jgi:hypothetical protein
MPSITHQTVSLARGRHRGPQHGVCAMELASMLGEERFSDRPQTVCPVIAAFLRGYNDAVDDRLRNDLFRTAAAVIGSRTPDGAIRDQRAQALQDWALEVWRRGRVRMPWKPLFPPDNAFGHLEDIGGYVGRRARRDRAVHELTLAQVEALAPVPRTAPASAAGAPMIAGA